MLLAYSMSLQTLFTNLKHLHIITVALYNTTDLTVSYMLLAYSMSLQTLFTELKHLHIVTVALHNRTDFTIVTWT